MTPADDGWSDDRWSGGGWPGAGRVGALALAGPTGRGDPLQAQFGEFYRQLLRIKSALAAGGRPAGIPNNLSPDEVAATVHRTLLQLLAHQEAQARQMGGAYGVALFAEAQYLMAALADETLLLRVEWEGRDAWQRQLLETALFGTSLAGERVFERLDTLLVDPARAHPSLATLYLITLALGFRGRYWRDQDAVQLRTYRTALARIVTRAIPDAVGVGRRLFDQSYRCTVDQGRAVRLPGLRRWLTALAVVVGLFLVGGLQLWRSATVELERAIVELDRSIAFHFGKTTPRRAPTADPRP